MKTKSLFYILATALLLSCIDSVKEKEFEQDLPILSFTADSEFSQEGTAVLTFALSSSIQKEVVIHLEAKEESNSGYSDLPSSYITFPSSVIIKSGERSSSTVVSIESLPIDGNLFQACFFISQVSNARVEDKSQKVYISVDKLTFYFNNHVKIHGNNDTDVFVLSNLNEEPHIKSISEDGTILFSESNLLEHIPVGSIICSSPVENAPNGYFYRVKSIHSEQGETIIKTESASLDEAIKEGRINETLGFLDYVDFVEDGSGNIIETSYTETRSDFTRSLVIPIRAQLSEGIGLTGSISLFGTSHFDLDISDWIVNKFEVWMESGIKIQTSVGLQIKGTIPIQPIKIATIHMQPLTFVVAGIPVVITQKIEIRITIDASGTVKLGCELLDADIKYKAGIQYLRETGWDVISENTSSKPLFLNKINFFDMEGKLSFNLPQYSYIPALYGITTENNKISENISFPVSIKVSELSADDIVGNYVNPKIKATWGAEFETEAKVTILSKKLLNYKSPKLKGEFTLLDKHLYPSFTIVDVDCNDANCAEVVWKMKDDDNCFFKTYSDVGLYWRKGEWDFKVKNGSEQKKSFGGISLTSELLGRTYTHTITNLDPYCFYSVRPYFVDRFGVEHLGSVVTFRTQESWDNTKWLFTGTTYYYLNGALVHSDNGSAVLVKVIDTKTGAFVINDGVGFGVPLTMRLLDNGQLEFIGAATGESGYANIRMILTRTGETTAECSFVFNQTDNERGATGTSRGTLYGNLINP